MNDTELFLKLFYIQCKEIGNNKYYEETTELAKWDFAWILTLERKWKTQGWMPENALKLITFVKGRPNFSCKSTTAANVDLTESRLDNWLKNDNHITVDKIYYLRRLFVFFYEF